MASELSIVKASEERLEDFEILKEIGMGATGVVFKVKSKRDQKEYALKRIDIKHLNMKQQREVLKEVHK